ncbi:ABC transporter permease subunit [Sinorhizobium meliloti]|nr:spermidine/putrescine ABC transporter permease [Sinorhizobium meliloti]MDW9705036.1 ABC transporter permease subunit [Sinorhizobium meliloti]MDW9933594.1 ABC transporter permease subunit [Sinorhizobium meliloti]MDX0101155.1 ABC transporter permease subunit [Sinorhizobium meliloti]MDX0119866.1 ABC transporter permease subunit [Sinorhizobium meliloti]
MRDARSCRRRATYPTAALPRKGVEMFHNRAEALALALPAAVFAAVVFLAPVVILLAEGFRHVDGWSVSAYTGFLSDPLNRTVFLRTLRLGAAVTVVAAVIGYAAAFAIVNLPPKGKGRMIGLVVLPLMISPVARTYAWIVILGRTGIVNQALTSVGLTDEPVRFLFTETAVFVGLLQLFLPLMILALISALENMPKDAIPAARVLGANWFQVFWKVILPLTREGLVIGGTLVFTGSLTAYITPAILGGSKVLMLETLLYQRVTVANDFVSASVIAFILIVMSFAANLLLKRLATARSKR